MKRVYLILIAMLLTGNTACVASFDCAKAGSEVEKMICADPELSKLDEEMGAYYFMALKEVTMEDSREFSSSQMRWLKYRDKCTDKKCLKERYLKRVHFLKLLATTEFSVSDVSYPPYPNVWQKKVPIKPDGSLITLTVFQKKNADLLIAYYIPDSTNSETVRNPMNSAPDSRVIRHPIPMEFDTPGVGA